jgi:iron complex outermembrane receptor protein
VSDRQFLWAAVSRAVRNPSRIERDFSIPGVVDPGHMGAEKVVAYELGYRGRMTDAANVSVSLFYNDYNDLRTNDLSPGGVLPGYVGNSMRGRTYGVEAWTDYDVRPWWRVSVGGSVLGKHFWLKPGSLDVSQLEAAGVDPDYWWKLRSQMKLSDRVDLDLGLRYYANVPTSQASGYVGADSYLEGEARLAWRVSDSVELSLSGSNLLHDQHPEASEARRNEIPRSVLIGLRWIH